MAGRGTVVTDIMFLEELKQSRRRRKKVSSRLQAIGIKIKHYEGDDDDDDDDDDNA